MNKYVQIIGCFLLFSCIGHCQEVRLPCDPTIICIKDFEYSTILDSVPKFDTITVASGKYFISLAILNCIGRTEFSRYAKMDSSLSRCGSYGHFINEDQKLLQDSIDLKLNGEVEYFQDDKIYMTEIYQDGVHIKSTYPLHEGKYIVIPR